MKKYLFFLLIASIIFTSFIFKDTLALGAISKLIYLKDKLGEFYIKRLNFELADDEKQIHTGCTEKYVLKASDGTKWLFKKQGDIQISLAYRLANILGINTPERHRFNISVNAINKKGFLQKMLPLTSLCFYLDDFIERRRDGFISSVLLNGLFCYLLCIPNNNCELLVSPSGEIYQIDLGNIFSTFWYIFNAFWGISSSLSDTSENNIEYLMYIDNVYTDYLMDIDIKEIDIDFRQVYAFLRHINEINNDWLIKYLKVPLERYKIDPEANNVINILIKKKSTLLENFEKHYSAHPNFHSKDLRSAGSFSYRIKICKKLCRDILERCIDLLFLKRQKKQTKLSVISSRSTWEYISQLQDDFSFLFKNKGVDIKERVTKLFLDVENKLISMRCNCNDFREKLAITLYIRQLKTLEEYIKKYCTDKDDFADWPWDLFVQIVQNVHTFKHPSSTDQWFSLIEYQTEGVVPIVKLKGEDEYIIGLIELINKRYDEAMQHLATAQKEGYAIDYEFNE